LKHVINLYATNTYSKLDWYQICVYNYIAHQQPAESSEINSREFIHVFSTFCD